MAKILSSLFIPIYLSWVVNQTLENLYWFLTLIAKRAVFEVFFTYLCLKVSSAVDSIHPEECSMTTTYVHYRVILCKKKKKKSRRGLVRETPYIVPNWLKKNYMQLNTNSIHFFVAQTEIENPALFYWAGCLLQDVWCIWFEHDASSIQVSVTNFTPTLV